jgi:hypothetical protein
MLDGVRAREKSGFELALGGAGDITVRKFYRLISNPVVTADYVCNHHVKSFCAGPRVDADA